MANPTRPVTDAIIDTAWGLAVADAVLRVFPNAATRDADFAGISSAELLGQACILTDTGALQVYAGPIMGWRPPWALPWGAPVAPVSNTADVNAGVAPGLLVITVNVPWVAGRLYAMTVEVAWVSDAAGYLTTTMDGAASGHRSSVISATNGPGTMTMTQHYTGVASRTTPARVDAITCFVRGALSPTRLMVNDLGPAANPTALVRAADGSVTVDVESLEPEYRAIWDAYAPAEVAEDDR